MKISFHGACAEVTGSCCLVETAKTKFLVDCGMFQGAGFFEERNLDPFGFDPKEISFVLLTHAHMDHCGRLPKLYKDGFRGKVYCTDATKDLGQLMMSDSARVIFQEALDEDRLPLYLEEDVQGLMKNFQTLPYRQELKITPEIKIKMSDAGHILGSAIFEVWIKEKGKVTKIVFGGDLGNPPQPIIRDPEFVDGADYVVLESTYGGLIHEPASLRLKMLQRAILDSVGSGGVLMIPLFALERTQEVLYELNYLVEEKKVPRIPIFLDSPLAIQATDIYRKYASLYDKESKKLIALGEDFFRFPGLIYTETKQASKTINNTPPPKVIMAGSGMCTGGRMVYHLSRNLSNPQNQLLIISYQVYGSLGRKLLDGVKTVMAEGQKVKVRAKISAIGAYSSHADQPKLLHWIKMMKKQKPKKIFVVHGEEERGAYVVSGLRDKLGLEGIMPNQGEVFEL